jgi:hypothetical protein
MVLADRARAPTTAERDSIFLRHKMSGTKRRIDMYQHPVDANLLHIICWLEFPEAA